MPNKKSIFYIMGVSGTGKTTVGLLLAKALNLEFYDGDDFHPKANVAKMAAGKPLNDNDRRGWLQELNDLAIRNKKNGAIIACSALKKSYRKQLTAGLQDKSVFVYLEGTFEEVKIRLENRKGHFMPLTLLESQFETLEPPKDAIVVSISQSPEQIVERIVARTS